MDRADYDHRRKLRGECGMLVISATSAECGRHIWLQAKFFIDRVINVWNALLPTVNFSKLSTFRTSIVKVHLSSFLVCNFE